jgi:hypothetical protein
VCCVILCDYECYCISGLFFSDRSDLDNDTRGAVDGGLALRPLQNFAGQFTVELYGGETLKSLL